MERAAEREAWGGRLAWEAWAAAEVHEPQNPPIPGWSGLVVVGRRAYRAFFFLLFFQDFQLFLSMKASLVVSQSRDRLRWGVGCVLVPAVKKGGVNTWKHFAWTTTTAASDSARLLWSCSARSTPARRRCAMRV